MSDDRRSGAPMADLPHVTLAPGVDMPRIGFGMFRVPPGTHGHDIACAALAAGYRHLDTAALYRNEHDVATALDASGAARGDVFVTTKLWNDEQGYDSTLRAFARSEAALGRGRIDLYLLHWPVPGKRLESWRALERLFEEGRVRAIGVSNFMPQHLDELLAHCAIKPMVNQVEMSPFLQQRALRAKCRAEGIAVVAYSPLTKGARLNHPVVCAIAARLGRTPAQVLLRWVLEQDATLVVKSADPARMRENRALHDFTLDADARAALDDLEEGLVTGWDPRSLP